MAVISRGMNIWLKKYLVHNFYVTHVKSVKKKKIVSDNLY